MTDRAKTNAAPPAAESKLPAPVIDVLSREFYEASDAGRLLIRRCTACNAAHWHPRTLCPFCFGPTVWQEGSGQGTIYSFTIMSHASASYVIAYVALEEGVTMMSNIVDCDIAMLSVGLSVEVTFKASEGPRVPCFRPRTLNNT